MPVLGNLNHSFTTNTLELKDNYELFTDEVTTKYKPSQFLQTKVNNTIASLYRLDNTVFSGVFFDDLFNASAFNMYYDFLQLDETSDADSNTRHYLTTQPFRLVKGVINQHVVDVLQSSQDSDKLTKLLLFNTKFSASGESLKEKELMPETLWGFRQKKYKRMKKFKFKPEVIYDPITFKIIGSKPLPSSPKIDIAVLSAQATNTTYSNLKEEEQFSLNAKSKTIDDTFNYRIASQINRHRSELVPVTLARRLLRTKRTLVLPAHVNLTLITNSYDVVHS